MKSKYLIDTPPPTISGKLHIGHIFSYTQADIIARYQKYLGNDLIYPFCFDNNGLPTQKLAHNNNIREPHNIINFSIDKSEEYLSIFKSSGISFSEEKYHTFDPISIQLSQMGFEKLLHEGIIFKSKCDIIWSEKMKCSISQSELSEDGLLIEKTGEMPIIKKGEGWFINIMDHMGQIKKMVDQIEWHPIIHKKRMDDWIDQIKWNWSISRERNYGVPIPGEPELKFDTWFISSMSPQMAWSSHIKKPSLECPIFDLRYQSHDIIRSWAFYTICMSYFLNKQIPWKKIMITGHTLDGKGNKFSKSSGNATNPIPLIEKYGPNGIRHWSISNTLGMDTKIDESSMKMGWRIFNKFKNAQKFINLQISNGLCGRDEEIERVWNHHKIEIKNKFDNIEIFEASSLIYKFFWNIFCDEWIERSKKLPITDSLKIILDDLEPIMMIIYENQCD